MKIKEVKLIDQNHTEKALSIQNKLLETFDKVQVSATGIRNRTLSSRYVNVKIFENKYDFRELIYKYVETCPVREYIKEILHDLKDEKCYKRKIASLEERFIVDLIESNNCINFFVFDNQLFSVKSEEGIGLNYIEELHYNKTDKMMTVIVFGKEKYEIDFINETIEFIDESEK